MLFVSPEALSTHFIRKGNRFTNAEGMEITWSDNWEYLRISASTAETKVLSPFSLIHHRVGAVTRLGY
jgi:hypothetical protein